MDEASLINKKTSNELKMNEASLILWEGKGEVVGRGVHLDHLLATNLIPTHLRFEYF